MKFGIRMLLFATVLLMGVPTKESLAGERADVPRSVDNAYHVNNKNEKEKSSKKRTDVVEVPVKESLAGERASAPRNEENPYKDSLFFKNENVKLSNTFSISKGVSNAYNDSFVYKMYENGMLSRKKTDAYIDSILGVLSPIYTLKTMYGNTITLEGSNLVFHKTSKPVVRFIKNRFFENVQKRSGSIRHIDVDLLLKDYIEISLSSQEMRLVKNGEEIVRTNIVTGDVRKNAETVPGLYKVHLMQKNRTLIYRGFTGKRESAHVSRWIRFDNANAIGIHDAPWRANSESWSADAYKTGYGSHGCINTPTEAVAQIYNNISIGIPVLVYK